MKPAAALEAPAASPVPAPRWHEGAWAVSIALLAAALGGVLLLRDPHLYFTDDMQTQHLPISRDIARALAEGNWPLLSPYSWAGGAIAAEYQAGVFSPFKVAVDLLVWNLGFDTLPAHAAAIALLHTAVLAAGGFLLGRRRRLPAASAGVVGLVCALNGWLFVWGSTNWLPALTSFTWLPWFWWAAEGALFGDRTARDVTLAAVAGALLLAAGWPFTVLMMVLLCAWLAVRATVQKPGWTGAWPLAVASLFAGLLAAPALLMLLEYTPHTLRAEAGDLHGMWQLPLGALPGLLLPSVTVSWRTFTGWAPRMSIDLTGGLVPAVGLLAGVLHRGRGFLRTHRWDLVLLAVVLALSTAPGLHNFRWPFRWLPLGMTVLALLGMSALHPGVTAPSWRGRLARSAPLWTMGAVVLIAAHQRGWGWRPEPWALRLALFTALALGAWALLGTRWPAARVTRGMPLLVTAFTIPLTYWQVPLHGEVPDWRFDAAYVDPAPLRRDVRHYSAYGEWEIWQAGAPEHRARFLPRPGMILGNAGMFSGLETLNGYSPMLPRGSARLLGIWTHGEVAPEVAKRLLTVESGPGGVLALAGVDGLVLSPLFQDMVPVLQRSGWRLEATLDGGWLLHREGPPSPRIHSVEHASTAGTRDALFARFQQVALGDSARLLLRPASSAETLTFAPARLSELREARQTARVHVEVPSGTRPALIVFARPWYPGYRAALDGKPLTVEALNLLQVAVEVPAGARGTLVVEYRPRSLIVGLWLAGLALVAGTAALLVAARRRRVGG